MSKNDKNNLIEKDDELKLDESLSAQMDEIFAENSDSNETIDGDVAVLDVGENNAANKEPTTKEYMDALPKKKSSLKARIIAGSVIAVVYVAAALLTTLVGGIEGAEFMRFSFDVFVIGIVSIASMEMCSAIGKRFAKPLRVVIIINIVLGFAAFYLTHFYFSHQFGNNNEYSGGIAAFLFVTAAMFFVCILINVFSKKLTMHNILATMLVMLYPMIIGVYVLSLNYLPKPEFVYASGGGPGMMNSAILLMFLIPAFADTGAFTFGSIIKGKLLAPKISPKKTISGAVGGIICGMIAGAIVMAFSFTGVLGVSRLAESNAWNVVHYLVIGAVGSLFVIVGDLLASYIKRQCRIKDFSNIIPGHGGILDRVDSMLLNAVFLYVYFFVLSFL